MTEASVSCIIARVGEGADQLPMLGAFARSLAPGGVLAALAPAGPAFPRLLKGAGLPLEIMARLPLSISGRRYGLFLVERLDLALL